MANVHSEKKTLHALDIYREMLCGHSADIYLQGYMPAIYPFSVFTSDTLQSTMPQRLYCTTFLKGDQFYYKERIRKGR